MEKKEANFFSAQIKLWARIFDYKGTSTRKEYWFAFLFHVIIGILVFFNLFASVGIAAFRYTALSMDTLKTIHYIFLVLGVIGILYLSLSVIPGISLTVRRLRDQGKSAWWTLLLLLVGIGHIILFIICAFGSSIIPVFNPATNIPVGVYGPPEMYDPNFNQNENVYGPPDWFDPEDNIDTPVYGPPDWFDDNVEPVNPEDNVEPLNPEDNVNVPVYGPPLFNEEDYYDPNDNVNEDVYGPPEWFENEEEYDPDVNINEDVYGPPNWYNGEEEEEPILAPDGDFDATENIQPMVYGPPDWFE